MVQVMRWPQVLGGEGARRDRARDWELTARVTLAVAGGAGVLAAVTNPPWAPGDLLVATYFAAVSLMLWGQGARIRRARSKAPFTTAVAVALGVVFAGGLLLAVVGLRVHADLGEVLRGHASLSAGDARAAFLHTLRPIVDVRGQRVDATDRMYLAQSIPFMIVWGERDPIIPVAHGRAAHERVPGSRLEVFPDAGHFPHLDDPLRFIRVMIDFVQTSPPARVDAGRWGELLRSGSP